MKMDSKYGTILLIIFIDLVGFGILFPLLPFYAEKYTSSAIIITSLVSVYSLMQFISAPILGHLSDRYGRKPLLIISQIVSSIGYIMLAFANNIYILFISRIVDGITGGNISIAEAYISDISDKEERRKSMGLVGLAIGLGFMLGPVIGGVLGSINIMLPGLFAASMSLIASIMVKLKLKESLKKIHSEEYKLSHMFSALKMKNVGIIMIVGFLVVLSFTGFTSIFALFTQKIFGYGERENGFLFAYLGVITLFVQGFLIRKFGNSFSDKLLLISSVITMSVGYALLIMIPSLSMKFALLLMGLGLVGIGFSLFNPSVRSLLTKRVEQTGKYLGILASYSSLARFVGPIFAGFFFEKISPIASIQISFIIFMISIFLALKIES